MKLNQVQGRYLATRQQLEQVRHPVSIENFTAEVESTRTQVGTMLDQLQQEFLAMHEVVETSQALSEEIAGLVENDVQMRSLLEKMNRKLDGLMSTLGNA